MSSDFDCLQRPGQSRHFRAVGHREAQLTYIGSADFRICAQRGQVGGWKGGVELAWCW